MVIRAADVESVDVGGKDTGKKEQTIDECVGVGACKEEDTERGEEDVDQEYADAG